MGNLRNINHRDFFLNLNYWYAFSTFDSRANRLFCITGVKTEIKSGSSKYLSCVVQSLASASLSFMSNFAGLETLSSVAFCWSL